MKFYSFNKIILCKENKICEIRKIDDFKLLESWEHIGDEIIAMNVYIKECKEVEYAHLSLLIFFNFFSIFLVCDFDFFFCLKLFLLFIFL